MSRVIATGEHGTYEASRMQRGIALVVVLWTLLLLSLIAAGFMAVTRTEVRLTRNALDHAHAEALADAGVHRAILVLLNLEQEIQTPSTLEAGVLDSRPEIKRFLLPEYEEVHEHKVEENLDWRADGSIHAWRFHFGEVLISIQDEGGKIDLNRASDAMLEDLFLAVGLGDEESTALADAIADFRDTDDAHRLNGAEINEYLEAGMPYGPKNRPFDAVEELQQVLGMTQKLYDELAPALTVHSGRRRVNEATAPPLVLQAIFGLDPEEATEFNVAANVSTSPLRAVTIRSEAHTDKGAVFVREAIVRLTGRPGAPYRIEAWKQGRLATVDGVGARTAVHEAD